MEARHSRSVFIKTPGVVALVPVSSSIAFYFSLPRPHIDPGQSLNVVSLSKLEPTKLRMGNLGDNIRSA